MIYFDNAATSYPKPPEVADAVRDALLRCGGNAGRGAYRSAMKTAELLYECRKSAADLFGVDSPERVIFTAGATSALNLAIKGAVRRGDHVLISDLEHNAVWRPVHALAQAGVITYSVFPTYAGDPGATVSRILTGIGERIRENTRVLICTHASNICSATLPVSAIGQLCARRGVRFIVDAAQSAGHLPLDVGEIGADAVCVPGHKGLLGPQGVGLLLLGKDVDLGTVLEGGTGVRSLEAEMPPDPPERYEAGTLPLPAIAGLREGIRSVVRRGLPAIRRGERTLWNRLYGHVSRIPGIAVLAPHHSGSVLSFTADAIPSESLAAELDRAGFCVRAGFHCAALAHRTLGTPSAGAVRVSFGPENTPDEVDAFAHAVEEIVRRSR